MPLHVQRNVEESRVDEEGEEGKCKGKEEYVRWFRLLLERCDLI